MFLLTAGRHRKPSPITDTEQVPLPRALPRKSTAGEEQRHNTGGSQQAAPPLTMFK